MKSLIPLTDQQLLNLYMDGNSAALSTLVIRYKSKLYTSIYLLVKDKYLAEDMFQEVFIRVINKLKGGHYKEEGKFLPWIMRIAHNMCLDHFRKVRRLPVIKTADDMDIFETLNFSVQNAEETMIKGESHDRVRKMLDMLPEDQREIIIMRHYADLTFKEIAALKDISINTALGRMRYGLINLRKCMLERQIEL
ncbi:MAG: sigma-70 family RNA polymerase sigma factor [Ferruginibacter sp.]